MGKKRKHWSKEKGFFSTGRFSDEHFLGDMVESLLEENKSLKRQTENLQEENRMLQEKLKRSVVYSKEYWEGDQQGSQATREASNADYTELIF